MTSETFYRIWWTILFFSCFLLFGRVVLYGQPPVTLDVAPTVLSCIPSNRPTIRMRVVMERHKDNRGYSLSWSGINGHSGTMLRDMEGEDSERVVTRFEEVSCTSYVIQACVYRMTEGKSKKFCDTKYVLVADSK